MTTPQKSAADLPPEGMAYVYDATATRGPRTHEIAGRNYTFADPDTPETIPLEDARTVAHIASFKIVGSAGERYLPAAAPKAAAGPRLRNDQVIATLDELQFPALRSRAKAWESHAEYDVNATRNDVIRFIMERQAEAKPAQDGGVATPAGEADDGEFEAPTPDNDGEVGDVTPAMLATAPRRTAA